jgi:hypothetical protein
MAEALCSGYAGAFAEDMRIPRNIVGNTGFLLKIFRSIYYYLRLVNCGLLQLAGDRFLTVLVDGFDLFRTLEQGRDPTFCFGPHPNGLRFTQGRTNGRSHPACKAFVSPGHGKSDAVSWVGPVAVAGRMHAGSVENSCTISLRRGVRGPLLGHTRLLLSRLFLPSSSALVERLIKKVEGQGNIDDGVGPAGLHAVCGPGLIGIRPVVFPQRVVESTHPPSVDRGPG